MDEKLVTFCFFESQGSAFVF